jgi:hypothetical protein
MPLTRIQSLGITDGTIVNADINASAAIASTKLSGLSSDFVLLATTDITSSTASVSFDGYFTSTYKNYQIIISQALPVTNATTFAVRYRRSNADITSANYYGSSTSNYKNSTTDNSNFTGNWATTSAYLTTDTYATNTTANGGINTFINIFNPLDTASYKYIHYTIGHVYGALTGVIGGHGMVNLRDSTAALSGLTFYFLSGNIASGNFKLYGLK